MRATLKQPEEQWEQIRQNCIDLVSEGELLTKLKKSFQKKKPLKIKAGFDPGRPDLHLGHLVLLNKLKVFQDLGHEVIFLIGDFTARIGDPSGVDKTRPILNKAEVKKNAKTYCRQVFKVLDKKKTTVRFNSEWMDKLPVEDFIRLTGQSTVARMLERDDFANRFKTGRAICVHEFLYPLIQGYDSVILKSDVELGGTDQLFNLLMGRELQKKEGQEQQCILTVPVLEGLDGVKKMSKSYNNYIAVEDSPQEMFGKTMRLSDKLMVRYYELLSNKTKEEMGQLRADLKSGKAHPLRVKTDLACFFVELFYDSTVAKKAKENFKNVFSLRKTPVDMPERALTPANDMGICKLLCEVGFAPSNSEARRLVEGGAVEINEKKINDYKLKVNLKPGEEFVLKAGKRRFAKVKIKRG